MYTGPTIAGRQVFIRGVARPVPGLSHGTFTVWGHSDFTGKTQFGSKFPATEKFWVVMVSRKV